MSTERVVIEGKERLEGLLREGTGKGGMVVCHPHPLYGGSMYNNVVDAVEAGYADAGYTTLRFNFRGVGASSGSYGEGDGETEDLMAAFSFLRTVCAPDGPLAVAGYSFGAWIAARAIDCLEGATSLFLVALPVGTYGAGSLALFKGAVYLVAGAYDDIAEAGGIKRLYKTLPTGKGHLKIIPASHFFESREREIREYIREHVKITGQEEIHEPQGP